MLPAIVVLLYGAVGFAVRWRVAWALGPLVVPAVGVVVVGLWLRAHAQGVGPEFTVDLHGPVVTTFLKQFSAALPYLQYLFGDLPAAATIPTALIVLVLLAFALPTFLLWRPTLGRGVAVSRRVALSMVAAGAWAWVVPSLLTGLTQPVAERASMGPRLHLDPL